MLIQFYHPSIISLIVLFQLALKSNSHSSKRETSTGIENSEVSKEVVILLRRGSTTNTKLIINVSSVEYDKKRRRYFYGVRNYKSSSDDDVLTCMYPISKNDAYLNLFYNETEPVVHIVYECKLYNGYCCYGLDCCTYLFVWWQLLLLIGGIFIGISLSSFVIWRWCCDVSDESKSGLSTRNSQTLIHSKATTKSAVVVSDSTTTDARKIPSKSVKASLRSPKEPQITTTPSKSAKTSLRSPKEPQTTT